MKELTLREKIHMTKLSILASVPTAIAFCNSVVVNAAEAVGEVIGEAAKETTEAATAGSNVTQRVEKAGNSFWGTAKNLCKVATLVALIVCGLILIIGTQKMKEAVKEKFYEIAAGIAILYLAGDICEWAEEVFG